MKNELLEYHRDRKRHFGLCLGMTRPDETAEADYYRGKIAFHEKAVAWLEGLIEDDEAMKVAEQVKHCREPINERPHYKG